MGSVVIDMSMSLDGYIAAPDDNPQQGLGEDGMRLHNWAFDDPSVFDRTVEFAVENKLLTASLHVLTPIPGTQAFARLEAEGRLLHHNWDLYDTNHAVFRPRRMTPEQLELAGRVERLPGGLFRQLAVP